MEQCPAFSEPVQLDNSVEEDLLNSFANLPHCERQAITTRLNELRLKLLQSQDITQDESKSISFPVLETAAVKNPDHLDNNLPFPVSSTLHKVPLISEAPIASSVADHQRSCEPKDPCRMINIGKSSEQECRPRNGCIVSDPEGELDKISEDN